MASQIPMGRATILDEHVIGNDWVQLILLVTHWAPGSLLQNSIATATRINLGKCVRAHKRGLLLSIEAHSLEGFPEVGWIL